MAPVHKMCKPTTSKKKCQTLKNNNIHEIKTKKKNKQRKQVI